MHLFVGVRGQHDHLNRFLNDLSAQAFEYPVSDPQVKGMVRKDIFQLGVRPFQFWEIAFPKEALHEVLNTVCPNLNNRSFGFLQTAALNQFRRMLGAEKLIAEIPKGTPKRFTNNAINGFVDVLPIGTKDDNQAPGFELI